MDKNKENLIVAYLKGKLSPENRAAFESWINESEENRKILNDFQQIWKVTGTADVVDFDTENEWNRLQTSMHPEKESVRSAGRAWLKVAASIVLLLTTAAVLYLAVFRSTEIRIESAEQAIDIKLPDGSSVSLNRGSTLIYEKDFENRFVQLRGEAFFDVKKDPDNPFVINTDVASIKVLGTSFNVSSYENSALTEVFVVSGRVSLTGNRKDQNVTLIPGMTGIFDKKLNKLVADTLQDVNALAWKDKQLVFRKAPLSKVVRMLSSYFNTRIEVANENLLECRFTGTFNDPTLEEVMETLELALNLNARNVQGLYSLDGRGCGEN